MSFSEDTLERFRRVAYQGIEQSPHALGMAGSFRRGNFVVVGLSFHQKRVSKARFQSSNCLPTIAAADWLCERVEGTAGEFVSELTIEDLSEALGGIPSRKMFCLKLALEAMLCAVTEARKKGLLP